MENEWKAVAIFDISTAINTGLDAIRRAPIVSYSTDTRCLRIQDISQGKSLKNWGFTETKIIDFEKYRLTRDDIIMARTCSTGICYLVNEDLPAVFNNGLARIRLDTERASPQFIYYVFQSESFKSYIDGISGGTSVQLNMKIGDMAKYQLDLPPLPEQKAIAHILGSLDDKIELNRRMNATLEGMAQALFKSWFVDFDPVLDNALDAGNPIPEELAERAELRRQALADGTANREAAKQFPAAFHLTEEMGWIPVGWEAGTINDLAELNSESWSNRSHPEHVKYVDLANTKNGRIKEFFPYHYSDAPSRARRVLSEDDTIIGTVRPGNRSFAYIHEGGLTGSTGFAVLRPKQKSSRVFIYLCLTQDEVIENFAHLADGGAYPAIKPEVVGNRQTVIFDSDLMALFDKQCYPFITKIGQHQKEAETLTKLRNTLLPKLISGELRIPNAEKLAEEAIA